MSSIWAALRQLFCRPILLFFSLLVALAVLLISIWLPSRDIIFFTITTKLFSPSEKLSLLWLSLALFKTNFTILSRLTILLVAVLSGLNFGFFSLYVLRQRRLVSGSAGMSILGTLGGFLGIGCSVCGSVILSAIFGVGATAGFLSILPFKGTEFSFISILILVVSSYFLARQVVAPNVCSPSFD